MDNDSGGQMDTFEKIGYCFGVIKQSWQAFRLNWLTFVLIWLLPVLLFTVMIPVVGIPVLINNETVSNIGVIITVLLSLLFITITLILIPANIITQLESVKNHKISFLTAFKQGRKHILNILAAFFLCFFISFGPLLLSIPLILILIGLALIPFALIWIFIAAFFLYLVQFIIIDKGMSAIEAIKQSFSVTRVNWDWVIAILVVSFLLGVAYSALLSIVLVGWFAIAWLSLAYYCMPAYIYVHKITNQPVTQKEENKVKKTKKREPKVKK